MQKQPRYIAVFFLTWMVAQGAAWADRSPVPVAPGGPSGETAVSRACPTFHWSVSMARRVVGYELAVYRVGGNEAGGLIPAAEPVLHHRLPAGANGWTLPSDRCLAPGGRYAWSVRAVGKGVDGKWSEPALFEVSAVPSLAEVEEALEVLRRFERSNERSRAGSGKAGSVVAMAASTASPERPPGRRELLEPRRPPEDGVGLSSPTSGDQDEAAVLEAVQVGANAAPAASASPSLSVDGQIHLDSAGDVFRDGVSFLWTDGTAASVSGSVALGLRALESVTSGSDNTAVGHKALSANTTGRANSAFGQDALQANTTGSRNSAFGEDALQANTTGSGNSAFGEDAMLLNTTGSNNSAFGQDALQANTTGTYNSAFGWNALQFNTTGGSNAAFGESALQVNTTGTYNSAFGQHALRSNVTGGSNSAFGEDALRSNTTGDSNAAFGEDALIFNSTGADNSAFGEAALFSNTTGFSNSAFGQAALRFNTTGSNNIALGSYAGTSAAAAASNNILIGNAGSGVVLGTPEIRIGTEGTQLATSIAGIFGVSLSGSNVVVNSSGQLGVSTSSLRFKEDVRDMGEVSDKLSKLRPVRFRFKPEDSETGERPLEYGLIAEEVAEILPELVPLDAEGRPYAVRYDLLSTLLLNELQRQRRIDLVQARLLAAQRRDIEVLEQKLAAAERASKGGGARKR